MQSKKRICTLRDSLHGECPSITILKLDYCSTYLSMLAKFKTVDPVSYVNVSPREREILITTPKCNGTRRGKIIWHWTPISLLLLLLLSKFNPDNTSTDRLGFGFFESGANWRSIGQEEFSSFFSHIDDFSRYKEPKKKEENPGSTKLFLNHYKCIRQKKIENPSGHHDISQYNTKYLVLMIRICLEVFALKTN